MSHLLSRGKSLPKKTSALSMSEVMIILILCHFVRYRDFKTFYQNYLCVFFKKEFPHLVSYTQFIELKKRALFPLYCFLFTLYGKCSGISFVDSTSLAVCHQKRIHSHRVFRGLAKRGKTTKGWFYEPIPVIDPSKKLSSRMSKNLSSNAFFSPSAQLAA